MPGRVAGAAGIVEEGDVEAAQAGLVGRQHVDAAAGIVFAVEREVVLEHEHGELRRWEGIRLHEHAHLRWEGTGRSGAHYRSRGRYAGDRGAAHAVAAAWGWIVQTIVRVLERVGRIARQDRDVVALGRVQVDRVGREGRLLGRRGPANAVAHVAHHRIRGAADALARFTGQRPGASRRPERP